MSISFSGTRISGLRLSAMRAAVLWEDLTIRYFSGTGAMIQAPAGKAGNHAGIRRGARDALGIPESCSHYSKSYSAM